MGLASKSRVLPWGDARSRTSLHGRATSQPGVYIRGKKRSVSTNVIGSVRAVGPTSSPMQSPECFLEDPMFLEDHVQTGLHRFKPEGGGEGWGGWSVQGKWEMASSGPVRESGLSSNGDVLLMDVLFCLLFLFLFSLWGQHKESAGSPNRHRTKEPRRRVLVPA